MQNDKFDHFSAFSPSVVVKFPSNQRISQRRTNSRCGIDVRPNHSVPVALVLPVPFALSLAPNVYISLTYVYDGECWAMRLYSWGSLFYVLRAIMPAQPREPARQRYIYNIHVYIFYLYIYTYTYIYNTLDSCMSMSQAEASWHFWKLWFASTHVRGVPFMCAYESEPQKRRDEEKKPNAKRKSSKKLTRRDRHFHDRCYLTKINE